MAELTVYQREEYRKLTDLRIELEKVFNEEGLWGQDEWARVRLVLDELDQMAME